MRRRFLPALALLGLSAGLAFGQTGGGFTLTSNLNPSNFGQAVTLTANPAPSLTTVTFHDGGQNGTVIGTATSGSNGGPVSITVSNLTAGTHQLVACYPFDGPPICTNTVNQVVNQPNIPTSTQLTSSANPASPCQSVTFTATVTANGPTSGSPTGTVTFFDGNTQLGQPVTLSGGSASISVTNIPLGTHQIRAQYTPDQGYLASSGSLSEVVSSASTVTLSSAPNPSNTGQTVTLTAVVGAAGCPTPPSVQATGTVFFFDGPTTNPGNLIGQGSVVNGTATFSTSSLAAGNHSLNAQYGGDANYSNSNSNTVTQVVNGTKTNTTTVLTTSANPILTTQSLTLTATVTPSGATGQVQFRDGPTVVGTATLSGGTASTTISNIPAGTHPLTAVYLGDNSFNTSTSNTVNETVNPPGKTNTTTGLTTSANPILTTQSLTLTATVTPSGATGQVQFLDGSTVVGTATLSGGIASITISNIPAGTHLLTAVYQGDTNFNGSTSNTVTETVNPPGKTNTTTNLSVSPNPSTSGQTVVLSATVAPSGATGQVQFMDGGNVLGTATLANGAASFSTPALTVGVHSLSAVYQGDTNFNGSTSNIVSETINPIGKTNTTTNLSVSPNPSTSGQAVTLSATVAPSGATGQVQFLDGGSLLGTGTLANGAASFATSALTVGTHSLTAVYQGDTNFNGSTSNTVTETVNAPAKTDTRTSLAASPNPVTTGQPLTLTASVTPSGATGTVQFSDNGSPLGGNIPLSNGTASFTTSALSTGNHILTASYSGDGNFNPSTSLPLSVAVNSPNNRPTSTSLSLTSPSPSTFGQAVVFSVTVAPTSGNGTPTGTVTLTDNNSALTVTGQLTNGSVTLSTPVLGSGGTPLSAGSHSLIATYSGDSTFNSSSSTPVSVTVNKAATTTVLSANPPSSSAAGQAVTLTARVTPATATGTVIFMDGANPIGAPVTLVAGVASTTTSSLTSGSHSLTAVYSGDGNFLASTSAPPTSYSVGPGGLTATTTTLAQPGPSTFGQAVTLTATVAPAGATGTVTFMEGTTALGSSPLTNGTATAQVTGLSAGTHTLVAVYGGDSKFATSTSSSVTATVGKVNSTTVLTATPNPSTSGQQVTLRATVAPSTATGTVSFMEGTTVLGTNALSGGVATITTSLSTTGGHTLTASYPGDGNTNSSSGQVTQVVNPTGTPLGAISPATLPDAIVGVPYSQTFTVTGGTAPLTWSLLSGTVAGITLSPAGVLSGTPTTAGTTTLGIRVTDSNGLIAASGPSLRVLAVPSFSISAPPVNSPADQPAPTVTIAPAFPLPLTATFTLSFTPTAANLPANYTNPDVKFIGGGTTSGSVPIPANATTVLLPAVQVGTVSGTITVRLATLTTSTGQSVLPANPPTATITLGKLVPAIVPGSVKIINVTATGFSVFLVGTSTPRDLVSASLTFTAASGATLNGAQATVSLTTPANTWFADTGAGRGVANGGAFSLTMPFTYSGDTSALGTVSVTITNSVGPSPAVSGGR